MILVGWGQSEFTLVEIVGYEVYEARSTEALARG